MTTAFELPEHPVAEVRDRVDGGPTAQVDRNALLLPMGDPAAHDPFLFLVEDWYSDVGFDWHPHRGFETITYVVDGELEHRDNRGGHGILEAGDAQWMTAGRGVIHAEVPYRHQPVQTLQLWINLPAADKMVAPAYQDLRGAQMPTRTEDGVRVRVFSGRSGGVAGPAANHVPVTMVDARLEPGRALRQEIPAGQRGFAYLLSGIGFFGPERAPARAGQMVHLEADAVDSALTIEADGPDGLHFLLWTGAPLGEPVVARGPFVMNTPEQIEQAVTDYRNGDFGPMPQG